MRGRGVGLLVVGIVIGYVGSFAATWLSLRNIDKRFAEKKSRWAS